MVKSETINNYQKEIGKIENLMKTNESPVNTKLELEVNRVEFEFQNNEHEFNYAKLNLEDFNTRTQEISKIENYITSR